MSRRRESTPEDRAAVHGAPAARARPFLFVCLEGGDPRLGSLRCMLDVDVVRVGRRTDGAPERLLRRERTAEGKHVLDLQLSDPFLSREHFVLVRRRRRWVVFDQSRFGTRVAGIPVLSHAEARAVGAPLPDGAIVRAGRSVFLFRELVACAEDESDLDSTQLTSGPVGLRTILPALRAQSRRVELAAAASTQSVFIHGPTGAGKELLARSVHEVSRRRGRLVAVNCAALRDGVAVSELFGARPGAFTGAVDRRGLVREAHGGTLFLDEIGDLEGGVQALLMRVLEDQAVLALGADRPVTVDLRVVSAATSPPASLVASGRLRPELAHRLAGCAVALPPLVERREEIGVLLGHVMNELCAPQGVRLHPRAIDLLFAHGWPGNLRELRERVRLALSLRGESRELRLEDFDAARMPERSHEELLRARLAAHLVERRGNVAAVSRDMGAHATQVRRWCTRFGLDPQRFRAGGD